MLLASFFYLPLCAFFAPLHRLNLLVLRFFMLMAYIMCTWCIENTVHGTPLFLANQKNSLAFPSIAAKTMNRQFLRGFSHHWVAQVSSGVEVFPRFDWDEVTPPPPRVNARNWIQIFWETFILLRGNDPEWFGAEIMARIESTHSLYLYFVVSEFMDSKTNESILEPRWLTFGSAARFYTIVKLGLLESKISSVESTTSCSSDLESARGREMNFQIRRNSMSRDKLCIQFK